MAKVNEAEDGLFQILCPACKIPHGFTEDKWEWNGDKDLPTINPSLLMQRTMGNNKDREDPDYKEHEEVCHSFVKGGVIQFLPDCTHNLSGRFVELPDWKEE